MPASKICRAVKSEIRKHSIFSPALRLPGARLGAHLLQAGAYRDPPKRVVAQDPARPVTGFHKGAARAQL